MVFSGAEIEQFIANGFVALRNAFPREVADRCREYVWRHVLSWDRCVSRGLPWVQVQVDFQGEPFEAIGTPRLRAAFDELVGPGRWQENNRYGYWSILFPGYPGPDRWHVEGNRHSLTSPDRGLVRLLLFSDVGSADGGTPLVRGSHVEVARVLPNDRDGIDPATMAAALKAAGTYYPDPARIVPAMGEAGDVIFLHPLLLHGIGPNHGERIRFLCNPPLELKAPMQLDRPDGDYSPVEQATRRALQR